MFKESKADIIENRRAGKVLGVFLIVVALALCALAVNLTLQMSWPKTIGEVLDFKIEKVVIKHDKGFNNLPETDSEYDSVYAPAEDEPVKKSESYKLQLAYKYEVDSIVFQGRDTKASDRSREALESLQKEKWPIGSKVQVAYNPGNHTESTLSPAWNGGVIAVWLLAAGAAFGSFKLITRKPIEELPPEDY